MESPLLAAGATGGAVTVTNRGVIATSGSTADGIYAQSVGGGGGNGGMVLTGAIAGGKATKSMSLDVGGVILTASALSFLGLGPQDPIPDWGLMVSEGQAYFPTNWWVVTFPGIAILLTAFAFNLLGDGLRDLLDRLGPAPKVLVGLWRVDDRMFPRTNPVLRRHDDVLRRVAAGRVATGLGAGMVVLLFAAPYITPFLVLQRVTGEPPRPVQELNPAIPDDLAEVIEQLLEKDPAERIQSAHQLGRLLRSLTEIRTWSPEQAEQWWETNLPEMALPPLSLESQGVSMAPQTAYA